MKSKTLLFAVVALFLTAGAVDARVPVPDTMPVAMREESPHYPGAVHYYVADWVERGLMTQEEADATEAYMRFRYERRVADLEYVSTMSNDERRSYMKKLRAKRGNPLVEYAEYCHMTLERARDLANLMHGNGKGTYYYEQGMKEQKKQEGIVEKR